MEISAVKELENNRSEIIYKNKLSKKNVIVRYFSVPTEKKDEFIKEFKDNHKKSKTIGLMTTFVSAFVGAFAGGRLFKNTFASIAGSIAGGLAFTWATLNLAGRRINNSEKKLFAKFDAKEHTYLGKDGIPEGWNNKSPLIPAGVSK